MQYQAKTKESKVYLRELLKDEQDPMPREFLKWFLFIVGNPPYCLATDFLVSEVNSLLSSNPDWISWLVRQGIIEVKPEVKQVTFKRQTAFSGKPITINPAEYTIRFYRPTDPNTVHVKFFRYDWDSWDRNNVAYFVVELTPEVLEKINLHQIKIKE
jgi:hypothetical protein